MCIYINRGGSYVCKETEATLFLFSVFWMAAQVHCIKCLSESKCQYGFCGINGMVQRKSRLKYF